MGNAFSDEGNCFYQTYTYLLRHVAKRAKVTADVYIDDRSDALIRIAEALLEREVLDGAEVKQLIDGQQLKEFTRDTTPRNPEGKQEVIRPEGGNRVPGLLGGERPQPA